MDQPTSKVEQPGHDRTTRRQFGRVLAGSAVGMMAVPTILRGRNLNEKLNLAFVGAGRRGAHNMKQFEAENVVAMVDVFEPYLDEAAVQHPKARRLNDFRKLFDHANEFDAVVVSSPEHTHAFATLPALQLGKHVYCEKPLSYNIEEARIIREAAAKTKVATQMGNQNHSTDNFRRIIELIRANAIGPVREAHVWVARAWGRQPEVDARRNKDIHWVTNQRPEEPMPTPTGLDWDLWLGPAPKRPFHEAYVPGPRWYRWWDFGNGTMSDLGSHWNDLPFWALNLDAPKTVESFGPPPHPEIAPASMYSVYEYEARDERPPVTLTWYQGEFKPDLLREGAIPDWPNGILFVGDDGMILADYQKFVLLPEDKFRDYRRPEPSIPNSPGHWAEWAHACKTGDPTGSNFDYAGRLTEANHLGNVAYRAGKKLEWDPVKLYASNAPEAEPFIRRDYRRGWSLG